MGSRLIEIEGVIQSSPEKVVHLVAERLIDRSLICSNSPMMRSAGSLLCPMVPM